LYNLVNKIWYINLIVQNNIIVVEFLIIERSCMTAHYVNNADFLTALKERREQVQKAKEAGLEIPIVSNYIGECILKIANHLSYKANFINYSYRDEMIADGIENSIRYIDNFDPDRSSNPFAYFTQIIYFAFLRRLNKEKRQSYVKNKMMLDTDIDTFNLQDHDEGDSYRQNYHELLQHNGVMVEEFEISMEKKKKKKKQSVSLEEFMDLDND